MSECKKAWKYLKGSEKDFGGVSSHFQFLVIIDDRTYYLPSLPGNGVEYLSVLGGVGVFGNAIVGRPYQVIAQREPVTTADVEVVKYDPTKVDDFASDATVNKYTRDCKGVQVDVYDVLQAFDVTNPALQHLIKKALCVGIRGHKTKQQDLQDIIDSAIRAKELEQ